MLGREDILLTVFRRNNDLNALFNVRIKFQYYKG